MLNFVNVFISYTFLYKNQSLGKLGKQIWFVFFFIITKGCIVRMSEKNNDNIFSFLIDSFSARITIKGTIT